MENKKVILANPRGFCAGVDRAILTVKQAIVDYGAFLPIYVHHEIVHNQHVVAELKAQGVQFVNDLKNVPNRCVLIYSAHGVAKKIQFEGKRSEVVIDATCPLVSKVHNQINRLYQQGYKIIMIGHKGHPEVEGSMGQLEDQEAIFLLEDEQQIQDLPKHLINEKLAVVTQTTLSVNDTANIIAKLQLSFPNLLQMKSSDICYATENRQKAVLGMLEQCDLILVLGSNNSSNSRRLVEIAHRNSKPAHLLEGAFELKAQWLQGISCVGVTAGASAPEILVQELLLTLSSFGFDSVTNYNEAGDEKVHFSLPKRVINRDG